MTDPHLPVAAAFVDGRSVPPRDTLPVLDPSTGQPCARVSRCGPADVDRAVAAARTAFETTWRDTTAADRAAACRAVARTLREHRGELAALECLDTGKPLRQAYADADVAARYFEFYAGTVEALYGQTLLGHADLLAYTLQEPHGVCGHIIPWNYPMQLTARTVAPALAAGNTCVLKPAEDAPLTPVRIAELVAEAGVPAGVLNVVPGLGAEAGAALAGHPGVDHLAFTGSRATGQTVMTAAARSVVPLALELGGKSPHLVFADHDPEAAVPCIVASITEHAGQNCSAGSRVLVHHSVHERLTAAIAAAFTDLRVGPGAGDPDLGPLISARQLGTVLGHIGRGRKSARLVTGGGVPAGVPAGGFYVEPTLFDDVPPDADIAQQEVFGPVLCVTPFGEPAEAVALANATAYGLSAGVWTRDVGLAHAVARELRVSQVFVNTYSAAGGVELPFGGCRQSGFGREKGFAALLEYTRVKAVAIHIDGALHRGTVPPADR
ncbi:aldehyde dehydrogenase family protein [Streptomyces sp. UNOC14_S4]|uniref:aldehyde dehydrogenase family protein n=1 Tax=Streptomyces sp. UNOC14_S4 TaxID=2872340 RepID=UPI001E48A0D1|nr:aldehyde dehydrogenase family protein [Streptomyces sp. UNOC14_S4]MCC3767694.1 aldehyde dehydrogenase family protein [Streptomyces sp. UNOC14_S4]